MTNNAPPVTARKHWFRDRFWKDIVFGVIVGAIASLFVGDIIGVLAIVKTSTVANGWSSPSKCGIPAGLTVEGGCAIAYPAINEPTEARYWVAQMDGSHAALNGANTYVLHFANGQTPPVNAFWSITTGNAKNRVMTANAEHKYSVSSHSALTTNADGSLDIYFGPSLPAGAPESNWLPTPDGGFVLWLRLYQPTDQSWTPPAIQEVQK